MLVKGGPAVTVEALSVDTVSSLIDFRHRHIFWEIYNSICPSGHSPSMKGQRLLIYTFNNATTTCRLIDKPSYFHAGSATDSQSEAMVENPC